MSRKHRNKDRPSMGDFLKNVPSLLAGMPVSPPNGVIFPSSELRLVFSQKEFSLYRPWFKENNFFIVVPGGLLTRDGQPVYVGLLCRKTTAEENEVECVLHFRGIIRVSYQMEKTENSITFMNWRALPDIPIPPETAQTAELQSLLNTLKSVFGQYWKKLTNKDIYLARQFIRDVHKRIAGLDAENVAATLDGIMNLVVHEARVDLTFPAMLVLYETNVLTRLGMVINLLQELVEGKFLPKEIPERLSAEPSSGQKMIMELLAKPREIPPAPVIVSKNLPDGEWIRLDLAKRSPLFLNGLDFFKRYMVNQERPIEQLLSVVAAIRTGLVDHKKPKIGGLFCGPTGVGKTECVKVLAHFLFGDPHGFIFIGGNTLMLEHSVSRLIGAEPGYIGYDEEPVITQWKLDRAHIMWAVRNNHQGREEELQSLLAEIARLEEQLRHPRQGATRINTGPIKQRLMELTDWKPGEQVGLVLIDETEKAHENIQHFLLRVLNDGVLQLANGEIVYCHNAIFVFTSNIYGRQIADKISGKKIYGIRSLTEESDYEKLTQEIYDDTLKEVERTLTPPFLGRIGKENIRVFHPFSPDNIQEILEQLCLPEFAERLRQQNVELIVTGETVLFLQQEAMDPTNRVLGARAVLNVLERKIIEKISHLLDLDGEEGIVSGDTILIDMENKEDGSGKKVIIKKLAKRGS